MKFIKPFIWRSAGQVLLGILFTIGIFPVLATACAGAGSENRASGPGSIDAPSAVPALTDLNSLEEFVIVFNEDVGTPRLLLLVSPT